LPSNFIKFRLHHPLVHEDYMIPKDHRELMRNPNHHYSCRCEPLRINRIAETVLKSMEHAEKLARSAQHKRGPAIRQLHLCANKRKNWNKEMYNYKIRHFV
jgi:phosphoribosylformylglycinamidine (FGAM) synthase-like amidotransferase family enzyme